jgi:V/A-type H+-transporting ATPase subunit E
MNGIQNIIEYIEADAAQERAAIMADAERRCSELGTQYEQTARLEYQKIYSDAETSAAQHLEYRARIAALEANKLVLAAKQELVRAAFDRAAQLLSELPDDRYIALLAQLASDASMTGSEQLVFSEKDMRRIGTAVKDAANEHLRRAGKAANLTVSDETRDIRGGLIVSGGAIETNCSFDTLVAQHRSALSARVSEKLFG